MSKRIFVGNLSWSATEDDLRVVFGPYGPTTDVKVITDRETGKSRGFGFVTFENAADADKAIAEVDGREISGREVRVNEAEDKSRGGGGSRDGRDRKRDR